MQQAGSAACEGGLGGGLALGEQPRPVQQECEGNFGGDEDMVVE